jgi:hypothetical protein
MTKIYLVSNIDNNPNKVYIGKTKNSREANHKHKFGNQIKYEYIDEVNSLDQKEWEPIETKWIKYYIDLGYNVINIRKKGGSGPSYQTEETKQKLKKPKNEEGRKNIANAMAKIAFNKERNMKISLANKGKKYNKKQKPSKNIKRIFTEEHKTKIKAKRGHLLGRKNTWQQIPVLQYDLEMNFINEYISQKAAQIAFNKPNTDGIGAVCRGNQKTAYGFIWKFKQNI